MHLIEFPTMTSLITSRALLMSTTIFIGLILHAFSATIFEDLAKSSLPAQIYSDDLNGTTSLRGQLRIRRQTPGGGCVMPMSMPNGTYSLRGSVEVTGGQLAPYHSILQLTCPSGYLPSNNGVNFCDDSKNDWFEEELAICQKSCKPPVSLTVEFTCTTPSKNGQFIRGSCDKMLPSGATATPKCRSGHHSLTRNSNIFCINGRWGYSMPSCRAECGKPTPLGTANVINGTNANKGEFPWHVAIYTKYGHTEMNSVPTYWCGGSIISRSIIISAAHCFYDPLARQAYDADLFTVAVGKVYSNFVHPEETMDPFIQKSGVKRIEIPPDYGGELSSYSHDLAILFLLTPLTFSNLIMPVCLNLDDKDFDEEQSSAGLDAKVVGFGLDQVNGEASDVLKTAVMPIIPKNRCKSESPPEFTKYIIWDKLCAGYTTGIGVCKGDSGGGLVVSSIEKNTPTWYLRGIVSTSPASEDNDKCSINTYSTFTRPFMHKDFIEEVIYREGCTMPHNPPNGIYVLIGLRNVAPGEGVGHKSQISLRCDKGYIQSDAENNICDEFIDDWIKEFPVCQIQINVVHVTVLETQPSTRIVGCVIPNHPANGRFAALTMENKNPGDVVPPHSIISLKCSPGYSSSFEENVCDANTNNWKTDIGTCLKMCDSLESLSVKFSCFNPFSKDEDQLIGCDVPVPSGSLATPTCEVGHYSDERLPTLVCKDGYWDQSIPKCSAICGRQVSSSNLMSNNIDKYAKKGEFPWNAVIYMEDGEGEFIYRCGGTIISRRHIISAAHCYFAFNDTQINPNELRVAVGKMFGEFNHREEMQDTYIQKIQIKKIEVPVIYGGVEEYSDLAIIVLETPIIFSEYVMPICLDLQNLEIDRRNSIDGTLARMAGFGSETKGGPPAIQLKALTMPIIVVPRCKKIIEENSYEALEVDKICAGGLSGSNNLCDGDSGSGLAMSNIENGVTVWYLRGVATSVSSLELLCDIKSFAVFTKPLHHKYFIEGVLNAP